MEEGKKNAIKNVILDVDPGLDDAWAIALMIWGESLGNYKILAITLVNGNTTVKHQVANTLRILHVMNRMDIPVYKGCTEPICSELIKERFFGRNGFMDVEIEDDFVPDLSIIKEQHAVMAIHDLIKSHKNVSLMCVGPLTNLAILFKLYPGISEELQSIWVMGGNRLGVGNRTNCAEFNFYCDPEAAFIAFQRVKCPMYMLPIESVRLMDPRISHEWRFEILSAHCNSITKLMDPMEKKLHEKLPGRDWWQYDAVVAACFINEKCIKKMTENYVTIELAGNHTRGQVVLDHKGLHREKNCKIIEDFDVEMFKNMILETVKSIS